MGLKSFLCNLLGCKTPCPPCPECPECPPQRDCPPSVRLVQGSLRDFILADGATAAAAMTVRAVDNETGNPLAGVDVAFIVHKGGFRLAGGKSSLTLSTDPDGYVRPEGIGAKGYSLIEAALPGKPGKSVFFSACAADMTRRLSLYAPPSVNVEDGQVAFQVSALDALGNPVPNANIAVEAHSPQLDFPLAGMCIALGNGLYQGRIPNTVAGQFTLIAQDMDSLVMGKTMVNVLPSIPNRLVVLGTQDPRAAEPYGRADIRVQLQDGYNNPLPPSGITGMDGKGNAVAPIYDGPTAIFRIEGVGYTAVPLTVSHAESGLSQGLNLRFAAAWLGDPGLIFVGDAFSTRVYLAPPPDRGVMHWTVTVGFNAARAQFKGFRVNTARPDLHTMTEAGQESVTISFESEIEYTAQDYPNGIFLGEMDWQCIEEGETCFQVVATMSPASDPWELCPVQKRRRDDCICVNIIYPEGNTAARDAGTTAAGQVATVISSETNVGRCCPVLRVSVHTCAVPQATINGAIGPDGAVTSLAEWQALTGLANCRKANCINMWMVPFNVPTGEQGWTNVGPPGNSALDPVTIGTVANVGAHEIGHALGLNHASAGGGANNLMHNPQPHGDQLTADQCKTAFQTLGSYPCT